MTRDEYLKSLESKCPNCDGGTIQATGKTADGYPMLQCDTCNTFGFAPVDGMESPVTWIRRTLHERGIEMGLAPARDSASDTPITT